MKYGAVNSFKIDIADEIRKISAEGFDFVDLTLEPAYKGSKDVNVIKNELQTGGLCVVGHSSAFLPYSFPLQSVKDACRKEFFSYIDFFTALGAEYMNIHPSPVSVFPLCELNEYIEINISFIKEINQMCTEKGIILMLENSPGFFNSTENISLMLDTVDGLKFHLDVGHAYLNGGLFNIESMFGSLHEEIVHLHVSDNNGTEDDHIPLGHGLIEWPKVAEILKKYNYDKTLTIEVFSDKREDLIISRDYFKGLMAGS